MAIGGGVTGENDFYNLQHVKITNPVNSQVIVYDSASDEWINVNSIPGTAYLSGLGDVTLTNPLAGDFLVKTAGNWVNQNAAASRSSLGLGSIATQDANNVSITGGTISGITFDFTGETWDGNAVDIAHGGTGQTTKSAAFDALSPSSSKGDLIAYTGASNDRLPVGADNLILMADSTKASGLKWASALLPSNNLSDVASVTTAFNNISPITLKGDLISSNGTNNVRLPIGSDGQVLTANSAQANGLAWQTLPPAFSWVVSTIDTSMAIMTGYVANSGSLITFTLPTTMNPGDIFRIVGFGAGGWKIAQNVGQAIHFGLYDTTTGSGGSISSTNSKDSVELVCVAANTDLVVVSSIGNISIT